MVDGCDAEHRVYAVGRATPPATAGRETDPSPTPLLDPNNRTLPLTFRTPYPILPHTNSYFHCLYTYLYLLQ